MYMLYTYLKLTTEQTVALQNNGTINPDPDVGPIHMGIDPV